MSAPKDAKRVRGSSDGTPITDGVFAETKEFLAGYCIVDVESEERAFAALAMVSGPRVALDELRTVVKDAQLATLHRTDAVRGHLLEISGDTAAAISELPAA